MVIWLIGLSGAGKTTIGHALRSAWKPSAPGGVVLVDGDQIREVFGTGKGLSNYDVNARHLNAERIVRTCVWLDKQDLNVICCVLSIFPDILCGNRARFSNYFEVFIDVPLEQLEIRDTKGLYAAARSGQTKNVVGIDIPFPQPETMDLVIDNSEPKQDPDEIARFILAHLEPRA